MIGHQDQSVLTMHIMHGVMMKLYNKNLINYMEYGIWNSICDLFYVIVMCDNYYREGNV